MNFRWFISKTVRHASAMRKHVQNLINAQRDLLSPQAFDALSGAVDQLKSALNSGAANEALLKEMKNLDTVADKWLLRYPNHAWRENVEVFLVALAVAMGIRTFFLQPFKIPTGSMQPTLFGVTSDNLMKRSDFQKPTGFNRIKEWFEGVSYVKLTSKVDGELEVVETPVPPAILSVYQRVKIGGVWHWIFFPPDYGSGQGGTLEARAGLTDQFGQLRPGQHYKAGEQVINIRVRAGDHLFVDRLTYNFKAKQRGEIIVFETGGTRIPQQDTFYIKRLVALGGERVQIGDDRHLRINGRRLDASTPHFENVYGFNPDEPPSDSHYSGHLNQATAMKYYRVGDLSPYFPNASTEFILPDDSYMVMGDNTLNSFDSRGWGEFPASKVIGKSFFVYWPITDRFGLGYR